MKKFTVVCGINYSEEAIINLAHIKGVDLREVNGQNRVILKDINGESWTFATDIKKLSDVLNCIKFPFAGRVSLTQHTANFNLRTKFH